MDDRLRLERELSKFALKNKVEVQVESRGLETEVEDSDEERMSRHLDVALKIAEKHVDRELTSKIAARMKQSAREAGQGDGVRAKILAAVAVENYQVAIDDIKAYLESRPEFPQFRERSERYLNYSIDLVNAIKAKRSFPGLHNLSMTKQQELFDRAMEHFDDLQVTLKKVEHIEREVRLEDVRSTVLVLKAAVYCVFVLLVVAFFMEVSRGVVPSIGILVDDASNKVVNLFFDKMGL